MTSGPRCLLLLAILLSLLVPQHTAATERQQTPVRDPRASALAANATPTGTAVISGALAADDGRPIRFAHVLLLGATTGIVKVTSSDTEGKFAFNNLPADRYTIGASKQPYLAMLAGAKRPGRPGTHIVVANGQKVGGVAIRMSMGGAITGVVTDERGQPGAGAVVAVMQWRMQNGERTLTQVAGPFNTDDEGRYRAFGLLPGEYVVTGMRFGLPLTTRGLSVQEVNAALSGGATPAPVVTPPAPLRFAPVYFPGTTRASDAAPITIGAGEERNNADFRLETVTTSRVEGTVGTADGQPVGSAIVIMASASGSVLQTAVTSRVTPDGRFQIPNAQPGSYVLIVNGQGSLAGQFARSTLEVAGTDILGVQLTLRPAMTMTGRLVFESTTSPAVAGRRIPLRALTTSAATVGGATVGPTDQSGTFTVSNLVPGRYVLGGALSFGPTTDTMTWTLQSVVADGRDLTDLPLEIADSVPKNVVLTYTDKWQELSGRLQSQSGAPVSDYTIIVFPEDKAYWFQGTRRIVVARPGTDGRFTLSGKGLTTLPPGKYLLAAVTDIGRDEQFDPAFLSQIVSAAIPITLGPGEKKVQDLAIR
jgi:hypothetical protein